MIWTYCAVLGAQYCKPSILKVVVLKIIKGDGVEINHFRQENDLEVLQLRGFMQILLTSYCLKGIFPTEQARFFPPLTVFLILSLQEPKLVPLTSCFKIVQYSQNVLIQACFKIFIFDIFQCSLLFSNRCGFMGDGIKFKVQASGVSEMTSYFLCSGALVSSSLSSVSNFYFNHRKLPFVFLNWHT